MDRSYAVLPTPAAPLHGTGSAEWASRAADPLDQSRRPAAPGCAALAIAASPTAPTRSARLRRACDRRQPNRADPQRPAAPRLRSPPAQPRRPAAPGCAALAIAASPTAPTRSARLRRACDRRYRMAPTMSPDIAPSCPDHEPQSLAPPPGKSK
ncbi:hypothetical protein B8W69_16875 [Mycobacterium vulneris]|uniref:Uncharacterized protein n=1 Tax=Mycolicibacterium vulneris TaxID=547163 RepID=A0A1X2KXJ7_9MYCO|nr:hypothetical protein B8W69_16875 [Mycolicibacterium vulneris]